VFVRLKKIVFVHGCFWHMHRCKYGRVTPATNVAFWAVKRQGNAQRDSRNARVLKKNGWKVLSIWECEIRNLPLLERRIAQFLRAANSRNLNKDLRATKLLVHEG